MPVTRTYCPPPPQNPADVIRADTCDPRRLMNPLAGITALHRNYPGYRHSSPDGDSPPFRITATHPVVPQPIMNYESCIMHCYTFSAKEKDSETGLSYFGSRYYSSDLSIWLSVDPMSDKYPSLSPYVYCANNPVKVVDPNGEEILITTSTDDNGNKVVNIQFTAKLVNKSLKAINEEQLKSYSNRISNAIKSYYAGKKEDGTIVNVDVNIKTSSFDKEGNIIDNITDHDIFIVDGYDDQSRVGEAEIGGSYMSVHKDILDNPNTKEYSSLERTSGHEFGHLLGLDHSNDSYNLMSQGKPGTKVSSGQIWDAVNNFKTGKINKGIFQFSHQKR